MDAAMARIALAIAGAALVGGCVGMRDHRGAVIDTELVSAIQPAVDNKTSVAATLGRPTFEGQFSDNDWYYVSRDTKTVAFRNPAVQKQTVVHVRFDAAGNVVSVEQTGKELVANIDPVDDKTPTLGRDKSLFEDLFGNIGTLGTAAPGAGQQPQ